LAVTLQIDTDLRIAHQPPEQIIRGGSDGIIAAETRIERLFCCLSHRLPPRIGTEHFSVLGVPGVISGKFSARNSVTKSPSVARCDDIQKTRCCAVCDCTR